jgi:hypothetical protein
VTGASQKIAQFCALLSEGEPNLTSGKRFPATKPADDNITSH